MILYLVIIAALLVIDQITKIMVMNWMRLGERIDLIPGVFRFHSVRNEGAAWSQFEGQMLFFYIITVIALVIFFYFLYTGGNLFTKKIYTISLLLIIAGAIGNFIDRILYQEVVDMLDFYLINFPVFNIADTFLTIGTIGFGYAILILDQ